MCRSALAENLANHFYPHNQHDCKDSNGCSRLKYVQSPTLQWHACLARTESTLRQVTVEILVLVNLIILWLLVALNSSMFSHILRNPPHLQYIHSDEATEEHISGNVGFSIFPEDTQTCQLGKWGSHLQPSNWRTITISPEPQPSNPLSGLPDWHFYQVIYSIKF